MEAVRAVRNLLGFNGQSLRKEIMCWEVEAKMRMEGDTAAEQKDATGAWRQDTVKDLSGGASKGHRITKPTQAVPLKPVETDEGATYRAADMLQDKTRYGRNGGRPFGRNTRAKCNHKRASVGKYLATYRSHLQASRSRGRPHPSNRARPVMGHSTRDSMLGLGRKRSKRWQAFCSYVQRLGDTLSALAVSKWC